MRKQDSDLFGPAVRIEVDKSWLVVIGRFSFKVHRLVRGQNLFYEQGLFLLLHRFLNFRVQGWSFYLDDV